MPLRTSGMVAGTLVAALLAMGSVQASASSTTLYHESFSHDVAAGHIDQVHDIWTIDRAGSGGRYATQNLSVADGSLRITLKAKDAGGDGIAGGYAVFAAPGQGYGPGTRFDYSFRVVGNGHGWGAAFLLWPLDEKWEEGELDFVEGNLDLHMHLYQHSTGSVR